MTLAIVMLAILGTFPQPTGELSLQQLGSSLLSETRIVTLPKGASVSIRIDDRVGSKISKAGDFFNISLVDPIVVEEIELVPAGTKGVGQVVHAAKGSFGGGAGELILAARFLDHEGRRIHLRSLRFGQTGSDNTAEAMAINAVIGPLGLLVSGGNVTVEPGTMANAKIALETEFQIHVPQDSFTNVQQGD